LETENWWESTKNKEKRRKNEHDKIIQYFPQACSRSAAF
jgi:hypothetical protein